MFKRQLILILFLVSNTFLSAQNPERTGGFARVLGMGDNPYLIDPDQIKYNPAWSSVFYDFIWGDIGSNSDADFGDGSDGQFAGINFRVSDNFTLGALLTRKDFNSASIGKPDPENLIPRFNSSAGVGIPAFPLENNFEAIASLELKGLTLGVGIAYAASLNERVLAEGGITESSAGQFGINFGLLSNVEKLGMLDLALSFSFPYVKNEIPPGLKTEYSQTVMGINVRAFSRCSEKVRIIPTVSVRAAWGKIETPGNSVDLPSSSVFKVGLGLEYSVGNFLFVGGPAYIRAGSTSHEIKDVQPELTDAATLFPVWNIGTEWAALKWLIARIGYTASSGIISDQTMAKPKLINETNTTYYSPLGVTLGISFRFDGFSLDATINDDVLRQGFNNIGGGPTFAYLSTSYAF